MYAAQFFGSIVSLGVLLGVFYLFYYIAEQFYAVAKMKGHTERKYLWIPFFLGIIGYLLVIALPVKNSAELNNRKE